MHFTINCILLLKHLHWANSIFTKILKSDIYTRKRVTKQDSEKKVLSCMAAEIRSLLVIFFSLNLIWYVGEMLLQKWHYFIHDSFLSTKQLNFHFKYGCNKICTLNFQFGKYSWKFQPSVFNIEIEISMDAYYIVLITLFVYHSLFYW